MKKTILFAFSCLLIFYGSVSHAIYGDAVEALKKYLEGKPGLAEAVALYPEDVRTAIFEASQYPQVLASLGPDQEKSVQNFKGNLIFLSLAQQGKVYDLIRFPKLLNEITQGGKKSTVQLQAIAEKFPEEIRATAVELGSQKFDLLVEVNNLYQNAQSKFLASIQALPPKSQRAFKALLEYPEVLGFLGENVEFTKLLGEAYRQNPKGLEARAQVYAANLKAKNQKNLKEWEQQIEKDPVALKQTQEAAVEFARDQGYDAKALEANETQVALDKNYNPYPYWLGYPGWYAVPTWRPYPLWYNTGWYYAPDRRMVWVGWPSYRYTNWYYRDAHQNYGSLSNRYAEVYRLQDSINSGFHQRSREQFATASNPGVLAPERVVAPAPVRLGGPGGLGSMEGRAFTATPVIPRIEKPVAPRIERPVAPRMVYSTESTLYDGGVGRTYNTFNANSIHRSAWGGMRGGVGRR